MNKGMRTVPNFSRFIAVDGPLGNKVEITVSARKPGAIRIVMADLDGSGDPSRAVVAELTVDEAVEVQHLLLSAINTAAAKAQQETE